MTTTTHHPSCPRRFPTATPPAPCICPDPTGSTPTVRAEGIALVVAGVTAYAALALFVYAVLDHADAAFVLTLSGVSTFLVGLGAYVAQWGKP